MKTTARVWILVNGKQVSSQMFESKDATKVKREASHWLCEMEMSTRATLTAAGVDSAIVTVGSDNGVIEYPWYYMAGSTVGFFKEGKVVA